MLNLPPIVELTKKQIYELEEDPVSYAKFGATGVIRVREIDARGKEHFYYFTPETFKKIQENYRGLNPLTRNPITDYIRLSPPANKKMVYEKAAKVIQKDTRAFLANKKKVYEKAANIIQKHTRAFLANKYLAATRTVRPETYKDYDIKKDTLIRKRKVFRLKFGENWKPTRPPRTIIVKPIDWEFHIELGKREDGSDYKYISYIICQYLKARKDSIAPGDIIDLDYGYRMNYIFYITIKGTVKYMPDDGGGPHATYITPQMMKPFYDIRETHRNIYLKAIKFYLNFLSNYGADMDERVVHKFHRSNDTLEYYNLDGTISREEIRSELSIPSTIRSPIPSSGGKKTNPQTKNAK